MLTLYTLPDYGMCWDEYYRWEGGQQKFVYYQSLFRGEDAQALLPEADAYPGFFDLTLAVLTEVTPFGILALGHGLSLAFGLATVAGAWAVGRLLGGERLAFWCGLFLLLMPRFYGQMFFNPKDIPFAAGMIWALYFLLRWGRELPRPRIGLTLALGVAVGLALAIRIGGLVLFAYLGGYVAIVLLRERLNGDVTTKLWLGHVLRAGGHCLLAVLVALAVLYPWWPYIHSDPLGRIAEAFRTISAYPWEGTVLLQGELYAAPDIPWYYAPLWLGITLPDVFWFVMAGGLVLVVLGPRRLLERALSPEGIPWVVVAVAAVFPLVYVIARGSVLYHGIRHMLFIFPPLACLAALAWVSLLDRLKHRKRWRVLAAGALAMLVAVELATLVRLHPYEYVYFNQLSGGIGAKAGRYDSEYWGTSLLEAARWLDAYAPEGEYTVADSLAGTRLRMYLPRRFKLAKPGEKGDFYVSLTRMDGDTIREGETVYRIERLGLPIAVVKDLRPGADPLADSPSTGQD
ncbi:MAG: phospholipid carrier-dependent glycosyltransferase [Verrucomicrobiota bacterium JB024]|nr:phospholipid carrier-dependent glycosyltransferase [Verrucomicrobiota bacterium JB024]